MKLPGTAEQLKIIKPSLNVFMDGSILWYEVKPGAVNFLML
jgi:hypothetical protein